MRDIPYSHKSLIYDKNIIYLTPEVKKMRKNLREKYNFYQVNINYADLTVMH